MGARAALADSQRNSSVDGASRADGRAPIGWRRVGRSPIGRATGQQARQDLAPCARRDVRVCAGTAADEGIRGRERAAARLTRRVRVVVTRGRSIGGRAGRRPDIPLVVGARVSTPASFIITRVCLSLGSNKLMKTNCFYVSSRLLLYRLRAL